MTTVPKRVIGYVRVSTEDQVLDGASLASQRSVIEATAGVRKWQLVDIIEDRGRSGKDLNRPGIAQALQILERGQADVLMAVALDRISRSVSDVADLMQLSARQGWRVLALNGDVDTTTAMGEAFIGISAVFAQLERRQISDRTKAGMAQKRAEGQHLGRHTALPRQTVEDIRQMRDQGGMSWPKIARALTEKGTPTAAGGRTWYVSTVQSAYRVRLDLPPKKVA